METREVGAPSALSFIAKWEVQKSERLIAAERALDLALKNQRERPPESDGEDYDKRVREAIAQRDDAFASYKESALLLDRFNRGVPDSKRDTTERISKADGERFMAQVGVALWTGIEGLITGLCGEILTCRTPVQVHQMLATKTRECLIGALDNATREDQIPAWMRNAFADFLNESISQSKR